MKFTKIVTLSSIVGLSLLTLNVKANETSTLSKSVSNYQTSRTNSFISKSDLYKFDNRLKNLNIFNFNENIRLNGAEIKSLGQSEIEKRSNQDVENNLVIRKNGDLIRIFVPFSDQTIAKFNDGTYINHKNVGLEVLKLVNQERARLGKSPLEWSDDLYHFSSIRSKELGDNGSIRFFDNDGNMLKHVRNANGKEWYTVFDGTDYEANALGENVANFSMFNNVYKAFNEKLIAKTLYDLWKDSPGHYANMIDDDYTKFGFDLSYSKFWRDDDSTIDYLHQGIQGVQLFSN